MKSLLPLLLAPLVVSCSHIEGNGYKATHVMTDLRGYAQTADRVVILDQNQSKVPLSAIRTFGTVKGLDIAAGTQELLSNNSTKEVLGGQATTRSLAESKEITKRLGIVTGSEVEKLRIVTPTAR